MLIPDCFGFSKPRNDDKGGRGTRNMGMLRAGSFPKPRNVDKREREKRAVRRGKGRREKKSCGRCGNLREGEKKEQRQG